MSARVIVLGGGFAGATCVHYLQKKLRRGEAEVLLIDRNNYAVFTPLLIEAGTGSLEPRHAVVPLRAFLKRADFRMAEIKGVDLDRQQVTCRVIGATADDQVDYDHLVIALGSVTRLPEVPGLRAHGHEMKSLADAVALRDRAIGLLEQADATADPDERRALLHFVVVGGNFTGVEVAGEFEMFLRNASRQYRRVTEDDIKVTLVELSDRILRALDEDLSDYATSHLRKRGVQVLLETTVAEIYCDRLTLNDGRTLDAHTVIWCAGIDQNPVVRDWSLPADDLGYTLCERDLRVKGMEIVWSIGDGAFNIDANGRNYPATAQHALQQGRHLARNLIAALRHRPTKPCDIRSKGALAALGCRTGVARVYGIKLSGFAAWWLWRSVYLMKMPSIARKARVTLDWTVDMLFRRDYVQLGIHRPPDRP
ncbi:MAG: NAD(P)/FAD-dependent oxidoreductase [Planctomycetota bacterium]|jgi:NADH dehydrogenase